MKVTEGDNGGAGDGADVGGHIPFIDVFYFCY